jgi:ribonuclease J
LVSVTFYGGVREIGGNKILVEDRDARILLDFGASFTAESRYFDGFLKPRTVNGAGDLFEFGLLPRIQGLYAEEALQNTSMKYSAPEIDAVFISHAHADHIGHLDQIDPRIPVYIGETAKTVVDAMREVSGWNWDFGEHDYRLFRTGKKIRVQGLEVEPVHVDHSIPGAYGFILHTSVGAVVYSGDLRMHGPAGHLTGDFLERGRDSKPVAMLCEGTRISTKDQFKATTEAGVLKACQRVMRAREGLIVTSFYGRDVDRLRTMYEASLGGRRRFVVQLKVALLLKRLAGDRRLKVPKVIGDDHLAVYKRRKGKYEKWERELLEGVEVVNSVDIRRHPEMFVLSLDFTNLGELVDIQPQGGNFINSMSEPFNEEGEAQEDVLRRWLKHFGMRFHQHHASGHAPAEDLRKIATGIAPRDLYPIHTEKPELFPGLLKATGIRVKETIHGKSVRIS